MTEYKPIFRSPIAIQKHTANELENRKSKIENLILSDLTGVQVTLIQGEAGDVLQKHLANIPAKPGDLVDVGEGLLARLIPTEFYLFGKSPAAKLPSATDLNSSFSQAKCFAHTADYTHGQAVLKLVGPTAGEMLSKICGLDFHETTFSNMQVKQTSAAKVKALIARCDEDGRPTYFLHVDRSLGQYFWEVVRDAGQEFDIFVGITIQVGRD